MHALAGSTRVGVVDEPAINGLFNDVHQRVMDNAVAERGRGDDPGFALVDRELPVAAGDTVNSYNQNNL